MAVAVAMAAADLIVVRLIIHPLPHLNRPLLQPLKTNIQAPRMWIQKAVSLGRTYSSDPNQKPTQVDKITDVAGYGDQGGGGGGNNTPAPVAPVAATPAPVASTPVAPVDATPVSHRAPDVATPPPPVANDPPPGRSK
jgi:hypothetical protein